MWLVYFCHGHIGLRSVHYATKPNSLYGEGEKWVQGTTLTFLARSGLAPKFSKVVAKAKTLGAIKKKR